MPIHLNYPGSAQQAPRDANLACGMSILLPGLGQLYNKEKRKAIFFMVVGTINYGFLLLLLLTPQLLAVGKDFGHANHFKLNQALVISLSQLQSSSAIVALLCLFSSFSLFAARDAYDRAQQFRRTAIYKDFILEMPEATSGSYIFHITLLATSFILAFFFLIPPPPKEQITEIEFKENVENTKEVQSTRNIAEHHSKAGGKRDFSRPSSTASSSSSSSSSSSRAASRPHSAPQAQPVKIAQVESRSGAPAVSPMLQPTLLPTLHAPTPIPLRSPAPAPALTKLASLLPTPNLTPQLTPAPATQSIHPMPPSPVPVATPLSVLTAAAPTLARPSVSSGSLLMPKTFSQSASSSSTSSLTGPVEPVKIASLSGSPGSGPVSPLPVGMRSGNSHSAATDSGRPTPSRAPGPDGSANGRGPAVAPSLGVDRAGLDKGTGRDKVGSNVSNPDPGRGPANVGGTPVDFSAYMAELQRRIKRAWFPTKDGESRRVKVIFKVHRNGEMTNLRLAGSSGSMPADEVALKAVEAAAPFHPLPAGAPADVDIEFTFDYNVFGGGRGKFRSI